MAKIEDVVNVVVALGARPITQAGFETPLFISSHKVWDDRFRVYTSSQAATEDGFDSDSQVTKALDAFFSQTFAPSSVVVGRRDFTNFTVNVATPAADGETMSFDIVVRSGAVNTRKTITFTVGGADTATTVATGLAAAVEAETTIGPLVTATPVTDTVTIIPDSTNSIILIDELSTGLDLVFSAEEGMDDAITAITTVYDDYFFVTSDSDVKEDIKDLAAYAEANKKIYGYSLYDADVFSAGSTTDVAYELNALGYANTFGIALVSDDNREEYAECAAIGSMASSTPGSTILHGKTLKGVTATKPTATQTAVASAKKINIYPTIAGAGFFMNGYMASGGFFDNSRGMLWLEARMEEDVFLYMANKSNLGQKIPADDSGITQVVSVMRQRLDIAVRNGLLTTNPAYVITQPTRGEISTGDLTNRFLPDIPFTATLAGAFQKIDIKGFVLV